MARNFCWINIGVCCMLLTVRIPSSLASECNGDSCRDVITMPLLDDMKATLKADLDVTNMNNHLKAYIEQQIQKGVKTAMKDIMGQLIDNKLEVVNATIVATIIEELERYGVTYVRWERKGCPDGAELVYTGQAGGNYYDHKGGGVNYLCLPNDPENGEHQSSTNSQLYGAEYQIFKNQKPHGMSGSLGNREVPCGVCHRKRRSSVITVPGRKTCYEDWNPEYNGYLMAAHNDYKRTDYACIDVNAEQFDSKSSDENGALFYPIRTKCGSLRCPPFKEHADVLCVVCTK
ncbi:Hypothetical predicted protein [Mytilus galloprovincialis]|uniref:Uncharacterized protein n=1 Tax=Mytilus galloprovincialis TaxID=29158 RepID=A0A8B6CU66_MYTGA|nr:Hypothetical predicted protein [Mytilus galloprovincialis]